VWPPGYAVALALDGGGQLVGGAGEALHALLARLSAVLFHRRHLVGLPGVIVDAARAAINYLEGNGALTRPSR